MGREQMQNYGLKKKRKRKMYPPPLGTHTLHNCHTHRRAATHRQTDATAAERRWEKVHQALDKLGYYNTPSALLPVFSP
jgi:hypothetical protein